VDRARVAMELRDEMDVDEKDEEVIDRGDGWG
jgi:hypothetical protein